MTISITGSGSDNIDTSTILTELTDQQTVLQQETSLAGVISSLSGLIDTASSEDGTASSDTLSAATMLTALQYMPGVTTGQMNSASLMADMQGIVSTVGTAVTGIQNNLNFILAYSGTLTNPGTMPTSPLVNPTYLTNSDASGNTLGICADPIEMLDVESDYSGSPGQPWDPPPTTASECISSFTSYYNQLSQPAPTTPPVSDLVSTTNPGGWTLVSPSPTSDGSKIYVNPAYINTTANGGAWTSAFATALNQGLATTYCGNPNLQFGQTVSPADATATSTLGQWETQETNFSNVTDLYTSIETLVGSSSSTAYEFNATVNGKQYGPYNGLLNFLSDTPMTGGVGGVWNGAPPLSSTSAAGISQSLNNVIDACGTNWPSSSSSNMNSFASYLQGLGTSPLTTTSMNGTVNSALAGIQSGLNEAFQGTTSLATALQTNLSFQMQNVNQYMGITQSIMKAMSDFNKFLLNQ